MATLCASPPDSSRGHASARDSTPSCANNSRPVCSASRWGRAVARAPARGRHSAAPTCARRGNGTERRARRCAAADAASRDRAPGAPSSRASPTSMMPPANGSSPAMARRIVVLPEPDGPRSAIRSPGARIEVEAGYERRPPALSSTSRIVSDCISAGRDPPPPLEPARQRGERQRHRQVQRGANARRESPSSRGWSRKSGSAWSARPPSAPTRATSP